MEKYISIASLCLVALLLVGSLTWMNQESPEVTCPACPDVTCPNLNCPEADNFKVDAIYKETFKIDSEEEISETLALEEIEQKSFKKDVFNLLELSTDIDEYKHITEYKVTDLEVNKISSEVYEVEVIFKTTYYLDGDEDEEEKAKLNAVFTVEEVDEDDNYEDAEVESYTLDLVKIYN